MGHTFTVYKTETCPFCHQALRFLSRLAEVRRDIAVKIVDANEFPSRFRAMAQNVGRTTVPQIFLDGHYVGGWSELAAAAASGQLDAYMAGEAWQRPKAKRRTWPFGPRGAPGNPNNQMG